jgi:hypothetical protein
MMPTIEMRKNARVYGCFPVRLHGIDASGCPILGGTIVDNIGAGGLYMQLNQPVPEGSRMFAVVWLVSGAAIAGTGQVTRVERRPHGLSGVAVHFRRTRLLPPSGDWAVIGVMN